MHIHFEITDHDVDEALAFYQLWEHSRLVRDRYRRNVLGQHPALDPEQFWWALTLTCSPDDREHVLSNQHGGSDKKRQHGGSDKKRQPAAAQTVGNQGIATRSGERNRKWQRTRTYPHFGA